MDTPSTTTTIINELQQELVTLRDYKKKIVKMNNTITNNFQVIDATVKKQALAWEKHYTDYCSQLITALKTQGITLTATEQGEITQGLTATELQEKITALQKRAIVLPDNISAFMINAYSTVVAAMSRTLQLDNQMLTKTIKKLMPLLTEEEQAAQHLRATQAQEYLDTIVTPTKQLAEELNHMNGLTSTQQQRLANIKQQLKTMQPETPQLTL